MDRDEILRHLPDAFPWRDSLYWFDTIDSTNTRAKQMALQGAPEGTILVADCQTGGRGSRGRSFLSPAGVGIYMSVILRPCCSPEKLMHLTCAVAEVMCDAVENCCGFRPGIKWTNDLVYGGRKLAGILTELSVTPQGMVDYIVIGIGVNCLQTEADFPQEIRSFAGSLQSVSGKAIDRSRLAAEMASALYTLSRDAVSRIGEILARYRTDCVTIGKQISLVRADGIIRHGIALDVDETGALVVRLDSGAVESVSSGEVSVRGMYGYL